MRSLIRTLCSVALLLPLAVGCGSGPSRSRHHNSGSSGGSSSTGTGMGGAGGEAGSGGGYVSPDAPKIISFSSTVNNLTEDETVQFIAIATDTQGLDTISGGVLKDETDTVYGAFGAGAQKGTYTVELSWTAINQARAINLTSPPGHSRQFTATFYDNDGLSGTSSPVAIDFNCGGQVGLACDGQCEFVTNVTPATGTCDAYCDAMGNGLYCAWVELYDSTTCAVNDSSFSCGQSLSTLPAGQYYHCFCNQ